MRAIGAVCLGLLLQVAAPRGLAATVQEFGTARLYVSVDGDGAMLFSNIPPLHDDVATVAYKARPKPFSAGLAVKQSGIDSEGPQLVARQGAETLAEVRADDNQLLGGPPESRDGGLPPDDH
jgi:hypothetical protein